MARFDTLWSALPPGDPWPWIGNMLAGTYLMR